jgi:hypothetical protein
LIGYYRPDPGPLTNARTLILGGGVEVAVRDHALVLRGASPLPGLWKGIPMQPADEDGNVYVVDLQRAGMPPLAIHVERADDRRVTLHFGGLTIGAFPALHKTSDWKNPRRVAAGIAAGAALTVAGARLRGRSRRELAE